MSKLPEVTHQDGIIYQGDAFLWEVMLYDDAERTVPTDMAGMNPRAVLTDQKGAHIADFLCSYLAATLTKPKRVLMFLPTAITITCSAGKSLPYKLSLVDSTGEAYRKLMGVLEVQR